MTRTDESLGGSVRRARIASAEARLPSAKSAFMISRSRRVRAVRCDMCRILDATIVACQAPPSAPVDRRAFGTIDDDVALGPLRGLDLQSELLEGREDVRTGGRGRLRLSQRPRDARRVFVWRVLQIDDEFSLDAGL